MGVYTPHVYRLVYENWIDGLHGIHCGVFVAFEFAEVWILEMFKKVCNPRVQSDEYCTRARAGDIIDKRW